jgi:ABC-type phosphate/phosphonate transport system permease subunit
MNFQQNARFIHVSEGACHLIMALYGYYLVLTDKVKVNFKTFGKAVAFIYASVGFGVFLNWCFHLSNFGMDMYGNYSIYFLDIFGTFEATFVAYLFGILATVTLGFLSAELIDWLSKEKKGDAILSDSEKTLEKTECAEKTLADPDAEANA